MKTVLITGASRGIGRACALALANEFEYIAICCRNSEEELTKVSEEIISKGKSCRCFVGDVSDYQFVHNMVSCIAEDTGRIDVLINNAGISYVGLFTDTTPDMWKEITGVNLNSVYNTCHCVVPHMVREKSGKIINISSVWGLAGASCEVAYSATKGAINSFTKALAKELAPSNISVNAIAFGAIDTDMNSHLSSEELESLAEEIPTGRLATAYEAAECIRNILSMPGYMTGEVIKFDGAWI